MQNTKLHCSPTAIHPDLYFTKAGIPNSHFRIWKDFTEPVILVEWNTLCVQTHSSAPSHLGIFIFSRPVIKMGLELLYTTRGQEY